MPAQWTAEIIGNLHAHRIMQKELAEHMGITPEYLSYVLNGKREPKGAEQRFRQALDELIAEREAADKTE